MFKRKNPEARHGPLTLLEVRVDGLHDQAELLCPDALLKLIDGIAKACASTVAGSGGSLVQIDVANVDGARFTCAWLESPKPDLETVARALLVAVRRSLAPAAGRETGPPPVRLVIGRGECLYTQVNDRIAGITGTGVSRLDEIARAPSRGGEAILVDEQVKAEFPDASLRDLEGGVYEFVVPPGE